MRRKRKIFTLVFTGVLLVTIGGVVVWQWNNIKALYLFLTYSEDNITEKLVQNEEAIESAMQKVPDITLRDLTDDERKMLDSGEISPEQAIQIILGQTDLGTGDSGAGITSAASTASGSQDSGGSLGVMGGESSTGLEGSTSSGGTGLSGTNTGETGTGGSGQTVGVSGEKTKLAELLASIYVLKADFINSIERLKNDAIDEYRALPEAERTNANKQKLGLKYLDLAGALEGDCDAQMNALLKLVESELNATGGDMSLVNDIKTIYANEKSLRKAEYLSAYK